MTDKAVAWLRQQITARKFLAEHTVELGNAAEWTELSSGVLMTCRPDAPQDGWDGVWPMGDSTLTRLMEANDPRDTIARCEAELAILDLRESTRVVRSTLDTIMARGGTLIATQAQDHASACRELAVLDGVLAYVASGYRHQPGYAEHWGS